MRVYHLSYTDNQGGAARAALRLTQALNQSNFEASLYVNKKTVSYKFVHGPSTKLDKLNAFLRLNAAWALSRYIFRKSDVLHSFGVIPSGWPRFLNASDCDLVHLHWINYEMLSISEITRINKPLVWTFHDLWPIRGTEHILENARTTNEVRQSTYDRIGAFSDRYFLNKKHNSWKRKRFNIIVPSTHMESLLHSSGLADVCPVSVVPNPLDMNIWRPIDRQVARNLTRLPLDKKIVLFSGAGDLNSHNKGFDLLIAAIAKLPAQMKSTVLLLILGGEPTSEHRLDVSTCAIPSVSDDLSLVLYYCSSDLVVVPSRFESFGQVGSEAQACGVPVVAFDNSGMQDVVAHRKSGYLARAFETEDLARGMQFILTRGDSSELGLSARKHAEDTFSCDAVVEKVRIIYSSAVDRLGS